MYLKCQGCGKEKARREGEPIRTGGRKVYPFKCEICGFIWTQKENPFPEPKAPPAEEVADEAEFPAVGVGPNDLPLHLRGVEEFNPDGVQVGQVVLFTKGKKTMQIELTDVKAVKTVVGVVEGIPGQRVLRSKLTGLANG